MKYYKNNVDDLIVLYDKEVFKGALLNLAFEFVNIKNEIIPMVTFYSKRKLENYASLSEYELVFSKNIKNCLKALSKISIDCIIN